MDGLRIVNQWNFILCPKPYINPFRTECNHSILWAASTTWTVSHGDHILATAGIIQSIRILYLIHVFAVWSMEFHSISIQNICNRFISIRIRPVIFCANHLQRATS